MSANDLGTIIESLSGEIRKRVDDKVLEQSNADLLIKLIEKAETPKEAIDIARLGTMYKRTGFYFDMKLEKQDNKVKYFKKNDSLSFVCDPNRPTHKLIIGDNYDALLNLLVQYKGQVDVIYIDPPYGKDSMGASAQTNYDNEITRDNLLSMLYFRVRLAKELLSEDGVIFCSIDDRNQSYVKCLFDEIFGESAFIFNAPRLTIKGGKTTNTIQKNHDYVLAYSLSKISFNQEEKTALGKYKYQDEFVEDRGPYALTQTLDYDSLSYSEGMDYELEFEGQKFVPGGDREAWKKRHEGVHSTKDWTWRWSKEAFKWGKDNGMFVLKGDRIYTKSYLYCRKKQGACELEKIEPTKAYSTIVFTANEYSNNIGKKELMSLFEDGAALFKNPKPVSLPQKLIEMVCDKPDSLVLDFFAGSGTTIQSVAELNRKDDGKRTCILCQLNEVTDTTPNGIAYDVTSKRIKRIMTGKCYDETAQFSWAEHNTPYGENLDVYEIASIKDSNDSIFEIIDEKLYGKSFNSLRDKVNWVCSNFQNTRKHLEDESC